VLFIAESNFIIDVSEVSLHESTVNDVSVGSEGMNSTIGFKTNH